MRNLRSSTAIGALVAAAGAVVAQPVVDGTLDAGQYDLIKVADTVVPASLKDSPAGGTTDCPATPGLKFAPGFEADFFVGVTTFNAAGEFCFNWGELLTNGGGTGNFQACGLTDGVASIAGGELSGAFNQNGNDVGDPSGVGTGTGATAGTPGDVVKGVEISIPLSSIGSPGVGDTISLCALLNNPNHDFMSNQALPGWAAPQDNLGEPRDIQMQAGQFISDTVPAAGGAAPTLDGDRTGDAYVQKALQTIDSNFNGADNENELNGVYTYFSDDGQGGLNYNVFLAGSTSNKLEIFIDSIAGAGQGELLNSNPDLDFNGLNRLGGSPAGQILADSATTSTGSEIDALYARVEGDNLYIFVAGNLETTCESGGDQASFNDTPKLLLLLDGNAGAGANVITDVPDGSFLEVAAPIGFDAFPTNIEGMILESGFTADAAMMLHCEYDSLDIFPDNPKIAADYVAVSAGARGPTEYGTFSKGDMASTQTVNPALTFPAGFSADYFFGINTFGDYCLNYGELLTAGCGSGETVACGPSDGSIVGGATASSAFVNNGSDGGDPTGIGSGIGATAGTPGDVVKGVELSIPLASIGNPAANDDVNIIVLLNNPGHDFLSNQALPGWAAPQDNLGEPRNVTMQAGQFATITVPAAPADAAPTLDGNRSGDPYTQLALQTIDSNFNGSDNENELNGLYAYFDNAGNLNIHIAGSTTNKLEIFIDSIAGGQNSLRADNPDLDFDGLNRLGGGSTPVAFNGDTMDDYAGPIAANRFASYSPYGILDALNAWEAELGGANDCNTGFPRDLLLDSVTRDELLADPCTGTDHLTPNTKNRIVFAYNNSNTGGITDASSAGGETVTTGLEVCINLAEINYNPGDAIKAMVMLTSPRYEEVYQVLGGPNDLGDSTIIDFSAVPGDQAFCLEAVGIPCDFDGNLVVNINDLLGFLADWFPGNAAADFDNNGMVNINDLLGFLSCWFANI